jgi:hypothetical protein
MSVSAPVTKTKRPPRAVSSLSASAAPSRASSVAPVRQPTKLRTVVQAPETGAIDVEREASAN